MSVAHILGIDPGLVHTGVVGLAWNTHTRTLEVKHTALAGLDLQGLEDWMTKEFYSPHRTFIEAYNPRSHFDSDKRMGDLVREYRQATKGDVINNTGVLKVIPTVVMQALGCWKFSTPTHHQDLRSAARIALFGMYKDDTLNKIVAGCIGDHLDGNPWKIITH